MMTSSLDVTRLEGDDRRLLRAGGADPFLFILLDSSQSMALGVDGSRVEAAGGDPRSRIYQAKKTLYELLKDIEGIHLGFATFNQDQLRVRSKHWLYFVEDPLINPGNAAPLHVLQAALGYPRAEPENEIEKRVPEPAGEHAEVVIDGDLMTFGRGFGEPEFSVRAGSCESPLKLADSDDRERVNRYSKLGVDSDSDTVVWVEADVPGDDPTYRLTFVNADATVLLGSESIQVALKAERVLSCDGGGGRVVLAEPVQATLTLRKWREFLMADGAADETSTDGTVPAASGVTWEWQDAGGLFDCGDTKAFSGGGWEGNYDTGEPFSTNPAFESAMTPAAGRDDVDTHCRGAGTTSCDLLQRRTAYDGSLDRRELDRGDMIPFHWSFDNRNEILARLNPSHLVESDNPRFGAAYYFEDTPDETGRLRLKPAYRAALTDPALASPIVPAGVSPVADAILDFRCWYSGPQEQCGRGGLERVYKKGFMKLHEEVDPAAFRCRKPFLIVISDMKSNCPGESSVAEVAGMFSETETDQVSGVSTWLLNLSADSAPGLSNAGSGREIRVETKEELRAELARILGRVRESARSFAPALAPASEAGVRDKIFLTRFIPRQETSVWQGQVHAYLKPPPAAGGAETAGPNPLWDAAAVLATRQSPPADLAVDADGLSRTDLRIGSGAGQRRLFYAIADTDPAVDSDGDGIGDNDSDAKVPRTRFIVGPVEGVPPAPMSLGEVREDLWHGLGIVPDGFRLTGRPDGSDLFSEHPELATRAHSVFEKTYKPRRVQPRDDDGNPVGNPVEYVLGDVFHAEPLLVGSPSNARYLARSGEGETFEGYSDFFEVEARRRKVLFVASNDGQLHAFDAGRFQGSLETGSFDHGTGTEIFAYTPREVLPTLTALTEAPAAHRWGVDGTPVAADVRIDARHGGWGSSNPPSADGREWRTVVIGGLRRGGRSFYALDVTRPDRMVEERRTFQGVDYSLGWRPTSPGRIVPECFGSTNSPADPAGATGLTAPGECDPPGYAYPEILWEFSDPDLGHSWSTPDVGAVRVVEGGVEVIKYVAVFGGGMDPDGLVRASDGPRGSHLYLVDIETGTMLYKRRLLGAAPAPPAAVDTDQDGVLDRIYIGTTEGLMYRVDVDGAGEVRRGGSCPATPPAGSSDSCCADAVSRMSGCVVDKAWEPYEIFDTATDEVDGATGAMRLVRRPIFVAPTVIFVSRLNSYALAFGTGNREDLWAQAPSGGNRFYLMVDDSDSLTPADLPRLQRDLTEVTSPIGVDSDLLLDPDDGQRGWFVALGRIASPSAVDVGNEKVLGQATAVAGLTVFSTFVPEVLETTTGEVLCDRRGISRVYTQLASNGVPVTGPDPGNPGSEPHVCETPPCDRTPAEVSALLSEPYFEDAARPCPGTDRLVELLKKQLFPANCNFANYRWNVSAMRADAGVECLAQIPVCIAQKNWKDE